MKQATRCIEIIRKFSWSQRINGYGDMVISHQIETALACGEITLDSVCHPIALKIREYDDKNGTDLLDVLATYIYSGLSVKISSEYLHMHINTVYQRIHKL
ncbi:MAG: helix-turn-helix domain-containing protein, partial [Clostridiales bacterium]|nr:helix-turn-helix domain-containing protein [Clostridiales bacterium]